MAFDPITAPGAEHHRVPGGDRTLRLPQIRTNWLQPPLDAEASLSCQTVSPILSATPMSSYGTAWLMMDRSRESDGLANEDSAAPRLT